MDISLKEPLATVVYEWTEEFFSQYASIFRGSMAEKSVRWFPFVWNLFIACLVFMVGAIFMGICICGVTLFYGWNEYRGYSSSAIFKSYRLCHNLTVQFDFYDSYVTITDIYGYSTLPYELLYSVKSSKYGYALCVSKVSGYFIPKGKCSEQLTRLIDQIRTTVPNN